MTVSERILVVDDDFALERLIKRLLEKQGHVVSSAASVKEARAWIVSESFALVLLDVSLPGESGLVLLHELATRFPDVAVVMVTASDNPGLAEAALDLGAHGYVVKPFKPNELLINVANAVKRRRLELEYRDQRHRLEELVRERTASLSETLNQLKHSERELRRSREDTIRRLARAVELRDSLTGLHIERVSSIVGLLAEKLGLGRERCDLIRAAAPLHDIGKIAVPDAILNKPGPLSDEERATIERHAELGYEILTGSASELLELAAIIAWTHHERFDGAGFPRGLAGAAIPVEGRITGVADVFDALTSDRPYRRALPLEDALAIMRAGRGSQFDPEILDHFVGSLDEVLLFSRLEASFASADAFRTQEVK